MTTQKLQSKGAVANSGLSSRTASQTEREFLLECRAIFLGLYNDITDHIETKEELITLLQQTGRNASSKVASKYWTPDVESLKFDDFVDICRQEPVTSEDDLMKAFHKIDLNGDGYISLDELLKVLTTKGEKMTRAEVKELIDEVDDNKDGKLDYNENGRFCYPEFSRLVVLTSKNYKETAVKVLEKKRMRKDKGRIEETPALKAYNPDRRASKQSLVSSSYEAHNPDRRASRQSLLNSSHEDGMTKSSPQNRRESNLKLLSSEMDPQTFKNWSLVQSKGTFFLEDDGDIISHGFSFKLTEDSEIWLTIKALTIGESGKFEDSANVDTAILILQRDLKFCVAFAENKDSQGNCSLRCDLKAGHYLLIPLTTGCHLKPRENSSAKEVKLINRDRDGQVSLTTPFRNSLKKIFAMIDLDGNGLLSRSEFSWYNLRTSGEEIADDEWQVVEDNVELENGEITLNGFIKLNEMEAEDNEGDTEDAWLTLESMGFNKSLVLDQACPFQIKVYCKNCSNLKLKVIGLQLFKDMIENALCQYVTAEVEARQVKGTRDLGLYLYTSDNRGIVVVENKTRNKVRVQLDCHKSKNLVSPTGSLMFNITVPPQSSRVGCHLLCATDGRHPRLDCEETVTSA